MSRLWQDGFLGTRASLMLDVVCLAMFVILPLLAISIWAVRARRDYGLHKSLQTLLAGLLAVTIVAFEVDMRLMTDWRARAAGSPYYEPGMWNLVGLSLAVHLLCAVPTGVLWLVVVVQALRRFPVPPAPNEHSPVHRRTAHLAAWGMVLTAVTGWVFYWLAFVAA